MSLSIPIPAAFAVILLVAGCDGSNPSEGSGGAPADDAATTPSSSVDAASGAGGAGDGGATSGSTAGSGESAGGGEAPSGGDPSSGSGGAPDACPDFAAELIDVAYGDGAGFGQDGAPGIVLGPPHGGGCCQGSLDVLALGNGGSITLAFHETRIVDGDGPDFTVFENPFWAGGDPDAGFVELGTVSVSDDGETWHEFPCSALEAPYGSCAGVTPVYADPDKNEVDPLDPAVSGGDLFDLAEVGLREARYVRIVDRADQEGGSFDLDAVGVLHGRCAADAP